jgi:hypothetical protein
MIALLLSQWRTVALGALCAALAGLALLWRIEADRVHSLRQQAQAAKTAGRLDQAQAMAAGDAETVVGAAAGRDADTQAQHEDNSHAIQTAPGAAQSLDPGVNAAGRRGLCAYQAYRDAPDCLQLRGPDPGQRPAAGGADGPAAP